MLDLTKIERSIDSFLALTEKEIYLNWAGLKEELNLSSIYEKYDWLFQKDLLLQVKSLMKRSSGEQKRKLTYILYFLTSGYLDNQVKDLTDKSQTLMSKLKVKLNGEEIPLRMVNVKIANEPNRTVRSKLFKAYIKTIDAQVNPILEDRISILHEKTKELGFKNYLDLFSKVKLIDFKSLKEKLQPFLEKTAATYSIRMQELLDKTVEIPLPEAEKHDISFLFRAKTYDKYFKEELLVESLEKTLSLMGLSIKSQKNIELDLEKRPLKSPRAFVATIQVPDDIKLVVKPKGGVDDFLAFFHEAGHAEHFANTDPTLPIPYKRLGDNSVTEAYAFLIEYLIIDEEWVRQFLKIPDIKDFLILQYTYKLYFLRRYTAKLSYEITLHSNGLSQARKTYKQSLEKSLIFKHPEELYLTDLDDELYCANYLRAWILEAQLRNYLIESFGRKWWIKKEAGEFLVKLWSQGQKYNAEEIAKQLGYTGIDPSYLEREIRSILE